MGHWSRDGLGTRDEGDSQRIPEFIVASPDRYGFHPSRQIATYGHFGA